MVKTEILEIEQFKELDQYIDSLPDKEESLIHILHRAQQIFGFLPKEVQLHIARTIGIPAAKVNGVVSFYSFFTQTPRGKHTISVCMGTACFVKGADKILEAIKKELNIDNGETTSDGLFTLRDVRCVGTCALAPVVLVDEKVYGHVTEAEIVKILESYKEVK